MAALWYNLPNYPSSLLPHIIPLSAAAGKEIGFVHVEQQQLHPLKQTTTSAHLPGPFFFLFLSPSLSFSLTQWWAGHPELFISVKWKSSWILNIPSEVVANLVFFFFLSLFLSLASWFFFIVVFFSAAEKSKDGRSHCQGVSKVNRLLTLCTYLLFSWSVVSVEGVETDSETQRMKNKV